MPGLGLMAGVVGLGSEGREFKSQSAVELIPGGVDSACHPSEVGKMSASMLMSSPLGPYSVQSVGAAEAVSLAIGHNPGQVAALTQDT